MPERYFAIGDRQGVPDGALAQDCPISDQSVLAGAGLRAIDPPFAALTWHDTVSVGAGSVLSELRWGDAPADEWLVQLSFVVAAAVPIEEFATRYRSHVDVARRHHPGIVRYAQHIALAPDGLDVEPPPSIEKAPVRAISELWFVDEHSLVTRYWADDSSRDAVRADNEPYVDFARSWSVLCRRTGAQRDLALGVHKEGDR